MIYKLRRKFVLISTASILSVIVVVFAAILAFSIASTNRTLDILADSVSAGGGRFPMPNEPGLKPGGGTWGDDHRFDVITPETPYSTRHFTVFFTASGQVLQVHTDAIFAITQEQAVAYAQEVMAGQNVRGWLSNYRYKIFSNDFGTGVVFVDGSANRAMLMQTTIIAGLVLLSCASLVLILIILLSKRAVKPIAESYEKQQQFITNANHELKTPLTLILANLDIAEEELGQNEWLQDIRAEGQRMAELVNQLVALSRMDEEGHCLQLSPLDLGKLVDETVLEFEPLAASRGKQLTAEIDKSITLQGDELLLRRMLGILLDNAIQYCDPEGQIHLRLQRQRRVVLTVENTYRAVGELELNRLFDRFYRGDKARTFTGGYGIGLSMAKAIAEKHHGQISAYQKDHDQIGFRVTL